VHAQVASVLTGTDIRMGPYAFARLLHAAIAAVATLWLLPASSGRLLPGGQTQLIALASTPALSTVAESLARGVAWATLVPAALVLLGTGLALLRRRGHEFR